MNFDGVMTTEQAAERLDTTERKLLNLLKKYPHLKPSQEFGGMPMWTVAHLDAVTANMHRVAAGLCWKCGTDIAQGPAPTEVAE